MADQEPLANEDVESAPGEPAAAEQTVLPDDAEPHLARGGPVRSLDALHTTLSNLHRDLTPDALQQAQLPLDQLASMTGASSDRPGSADTTVVLRRHTIDILALKSEVSELRQHDMKSARASFQAGGQVNGPGGETDDAIPARLSQGEFVLSAADVRRLGGPEAVDALRHDGRGHAEGGAVTQSAAFQKWFGDSKVVDKQGSPLTMYHGTPSGGFAAFDKDKQWNSEKQLYGPGFYFTDSAQVATEYRDKGARYELAGGAEQILPEYERRLVARKIIQPGEFTQDQLRQSLTGQEPFDHEYFGVQVNDLRKLPASAHVYPVHLQIRNPLDADRDRVPFQALPEATQALFQQRAGEAVFTSPVNQDLQEKLARIRAALADPQTTDRAKWEKRLAKYEPQWQAVAQEAQTAQQAATEQTYGYRDLEANLRSRKATNDLLQQIGYDGITHEGGQVLGRGAAHRVWIGFEPTQIKSATGNSGAFDPQDPNIYRAEGGQVLGAGGPTDDAIPAKLSNGEFVLSAADVRHLGGPEAVDALRHGFAQGGPVGEGGDGLSDALRELITEVKGLREDVKGIGGKQEPGRVPGMTTGKNVLVDMWGKS